MRRSLLTGVAVTAAAGAFVALGTPSALASERGGGHGGDRHQVVDVLGDGSAAHLSTTHVHAGSITFTVHTNDPTAPDGSGGSQVTMFRLKNGADLNKIFGDLGEEFGSDPAKGTRDLVHDAAFYGLADVAAATPATVTENLSPGTYYLLDLAKPPQPPNTPSVATLTVDGNRKGVEQDSDLRSQVTVTAVEPDRFATSRNWPRHGTFTFTNRTDTIHFVELQPVKAGTTDQQVQAFFDSQSPQQPPPFADPTRPSVGADVLSPGKSLQLSYSLPRGTYVLLCFVADDQTGMPHAVMGMHKVVVLH